MNKQEAAEFLGVSVRALERYVQQGRISVRYEKGKTRSTANYDQSELEAFKGELNQPTIKPAVETRQTPPNLEPRQIPTDLQTETDKPVLYSGEISEFGEIGVIERLSSIIEALLGRADNPVLSLSEENNLECLQHKTLTKNLDFSHSVRK